MIRLSRREDYAVILVNKLATSYNKRLIPLSEIAKEYHISVLFLRNLAFELKNAGLIKASEGKKGGYTLSKDPKKLRIGDVLRVISQKPMLPCCSFGMGRTSCPKESICEPGHIWRKLHQEFLDKIYSLSLDEFMHYKRT